jgi:hypothetical protein
MGGNVYKASSGLAGASINGYAGNFGGTSAASAIIAGRGRVGTGNGLGGHRQPGLRRTAPAAPAQ